MRGIYFRYSIKHPIDDVHKAQHVDRKEAFSVQNLDAFVLIGYSVTTKTVITVR